MSDDYAVPKPVACPNFNMTSKLVFNAYNMAHLPLKSERENVQVPTPSPKSSL